MRGIFMKKCPSLFFKKMKKRTWFITPHDNLNILKVSWIPLSVKWRFLIKGGQLDPFVGWFAGVKRDVENIPKLHSCPTIHSGSGLDLSNCYLTPFRWSDCCRNWNQMYIYPSLLNLLWMTAQIWYKSQRLQPEFLNITQILLEYDLNITQALDRGQFDQ